MRNLIAIAATLSLSAGGFAQIQIASAQTPAQPSSNSAAASSNDSADAARLATPIQAKPNSEKFSTEAYVDLHRVFKGLPAFNNQMSDLKVKIQKFDQECKDQQLKLNALRDELKATTDAARRKQLEVEVAADQAALQSRVAETKKQFLADEAQIYNDFYEQLRSTVADYAKEHGIRRVTRSQLVATAEDKVEANDRTAVMQRLNRPIVYLEGPTETSADITDAVLQRLIGTQTR